MRKIAAVRKEVPLSGYTKNEVEEETWAGYWESAACCVLAILL